MIDVCLIGTGGMMPLPGRGLTALHVRCGGRALLIDCGEGVQTSIRMAGLRFKPIEALLVTHYHADHISGLPGFLLTLGNEGRTRPLAIYGPEGLARVVQGLRVIVPELPFEIELHELPMAETRFDCAGLEICAFEADHGMPCLGYGLELKRPGRFDAARAKEKGVPLALWGRLQAGEAAGGFVPGDVLGEARRGIRLLYCTDSRPVPGIESCGRDADLLVLEGMFGEESKQERAAESRHMMMQEAAELARKCNAKALWLTHFSPATPDPGEFEAGLRAIFPGTTIGTDGMRTTLGFSDAREDERWQT